MNHHVCNVDLPQGGRLTLQMEFFLKIVTYGLKKRIWMNTMKRQVLPLMVGESILPRFSQGLDNAGS